MCVDATEERAMVQVKHLINTLFILRQSRAEGQVKPRWTLQSEPTLRHATCGKRNGQLFCGYSISNRHTVPEPVLPSKEKKFAIGGSRAANAFKISWANIPPTTAHTGENSCAAVVDIVL